MHMVALWRRAARNLSLEHRQDMVALNISQPAAYRQSTAGHLTEGQHPILGHDFAAHHRGCASVGLGCCATVRREQAF